MFKYYKHDGAKIVEQVQESEYDSSTCIKVHKDHDLDQQLISDGNYIVYQREDSDSMGVGLSSKYFSKLHLNNTDWKATRHRDQLASGVTTSLTDEEYQALLTSRQTWREKASE
tara:strand:- start:3809 stop:4150 length:342 start_codon:yes stop_codon:yes gene_type:complete